jgi:DNA-binding transcriptional MerR regulator
MHPCALPVLDPRWSDDAAAPAAAEPEGPAFTIAQLAGEFGLTLRALRFYESRGFLAPRRAGAARFFSRTDHDRIALILRAKRLGFTLREIASLIAEGARGADYGSLNLSRQQCTEQINLLERQKREIEAALTELRRVYSMQYMRELAGDPGARN